MRAFLVASLLMFSYGLIAQQSQSHFNKVEVSDESVDVWLQRLSANQDDFSANYNVGIHYYNEAVQMIAHMPMEFGSDAHTAMVEKIAAKFRAALPYAEKAHNLNQGHKETMLMLSGIHFGVGDIASSERYKALAVK